MSELTLYNLTRAITFLGARKDTGMYEPITTTIIKGAFKARVRDQYEIIIHSFLVNDTFVELDRSVSVVIKPTIIAMQQVVR